MEFKKPVFEPVSGSRKASGAPPVYRPEPVARPTLPGAKRAIMQRKPAMAPPLVYRPKTAAVAVPKVLQQKPAFATSPAQTQAAPPVFRPVSFGVAGPAPRQRSIQRQPERRLGPPLSSPAIQRSNSGRASIAVPRPPLRAASKGQGVLQAKLPKWAGKRELDRLLTNSGIVLEGTQKAPLDIIAEQIGAMADTTPENVTERILSDPAIASVFRTARLAPDTSPWKTVEGLSETETRVLEALKKTTFFSGTKAEYVENVRTFGLDPSHGGKKGGASDTLSVSSKRDTHMKESKGKVYVTRSFKEASGYAEKGTEPVMIFVPTASQKGLQVDPRSQTGMYSEERLGMADQEGGVFGGGAIGMLRNELASDTSKETPSTKEIREAYLKLLSKGALPQRQEKLSELPELLKMWTPILEALTDPSNGPINMVAATVIEELNGSSEVEQLVLLRRLRPLKNTEGRIVGIMGYLRGG